MHNSEMAGQAMPRTGQQYCIHHGDYSAVVTELGATLRVLRYQDQDLIASFEPDGLVPCSNGCVLVPYPNRIEDGEYTFQGKTYSMPIDEHGRRTAIHGFGYRYYWKLERLSESSVTLVWRVPDLASYPFDVLVGVTYTLDDRGLTMTTTATNMGDEAAPWAFGIHPWLANGANGKGDAIQEDNGRCSLSLPCRTHIIASPDRLLPQGKEPVEGRTDLREGPSLEGQAFDDAWTDVDRAGDGTCTAVFTRPDGIRIQLWGDETITSWQVCTGTGFDASFRPAGVAVEPMTAYANAFRTGENLVVLQPASVYTTQIGYRAERV
ncbi:Aldose 1-epimerase [Bifidobacterium coryneforme]|nr:aldose 1-epimerase family protein [Bifidobacterium coryneforme]KJY53124.1 Aldose 1-epimerase [Bifidobacterium coryneforme]PXY80106.1 aldose epimerase [Bifidobacterium indicum]